MKKGIVAAVLIVSVIFVSAGYLLYRVGKDKAAMSRCGCGKKRLMEKQMLCKEEKG